MFHIHLIGQVNIVKMSVFSNLMCKFKTISIMIQGSFNHQTDSKNYMENQRTCNSQNKSEREQR